jgi:hypothetical protein
MEPRCKASKFMIEMLKKNEVKFKVYNVLDDY